MLTIRYLRVGRRNSAFFRIVLTEKSKPAKSGFQKVLGWYNPHTKESSLKKEEILKYIGNGAIASNSVAKLLINNKITHKNIKFVKDAPGKTKKKQIDEKPMAKPEETETQAPEEVNKDIETVEEIEKSVKKQKETAKTQENEVPKEAAKTEPKAEKEETENNEEVPTSEAVETPTDNVGGQEDKK